MESFPFFGDLVFDQAGNLYGTTIEGGSNGQGVVYELSPSAGGWTQNILYNMEGQTSGYFPYSGVILDGVGTLYGTSSMGGAYNYGAVYQLTASAVGWTENTVYSFQNDGDGSIPIGGVIVDQYRQSLRDHRGHTGGYGFRVDALQRRVDIQRALQF